MTEARKPKNTLADKLTARQRLILALVGQGMTDKQIAGQVGIACKTVRRDKRHAISVCRLHFHEAGELDLSFAEDESEQKCPL